MGLPERIVFIRHGESVRNEAKKEAVYFADAAARAKVRGIGDHLIPLTEEGARQARETGKALRERFGRPDTLYHSGYRRTADTAAGILSAYSDEDRAVICQQEHLFLRERDSGHAYDMTADEVREAMPFMREYWETVGGFFAHPPGGESSAQVAQRVWLFLQFELFVKHAGQTVFIVTHAGTLRCFRYWLEHWSYEQARIWNGDLPPSNCGVTVYNDAGPPTHLRLYQYDTVYWQRATEG